MSDVVYLYGFVPEAADPPSTDLTGLADRPVELIEVANFQAAVSHLPPEPYQASVIEAKLEDLRWVAEQGLAHERVVAWFVDHAYIIPVPLFTLYSSADALVAAAWVRAAQIHTQLRRFESVREWDLKVGYRADDLARHAGQLSEEVQQLDEQIATATPGRRFLLARKREEVVRATIGQLARDHADGLLTELRRRAQDVVVLPLPHADQDLPVVLHAALLVESAEEPRLADDVARRAADLDTVGLTIQFSGPWAPYRFLDNGN